MTWSSASGARLWVEDDRVILQQGAERQAVDRQAFWAGELHDAIVAALGEAVLDEVIAAVGLPTLSPRVVEAVAPQLAELRAARQTLYRLLETRTAEADEALERLTLIIDAISDAILVSDPEGRVRLTNPAVRAMFGVGELVVGQPLADAFPPAVAQVVHSTGDGEQQQAVLQLPRGRTGKAVAHAMHADDGTRLGTVTVVHDISYEKEVERVKAEFVANVSHELRTPLTSILGFASLLDKRLGELLPRIDAPDRRTQRQIRQAHDNVRILVTEGERLTGLINEVLDLSRMEAGTMDWSLKSVRIDDAVTEAVDITRSMFEGLDLRVELGDCPPVHADPDRLTQVMVHLLSNAAKFTDVGSVTVRTRTTGDEIEVCVADTGRGIAEEALATVFEKFHQGGDALTSKPIGTGLGLPVSRHIVEHHGGRIRATSAVDVGTTVTFWLPAEPT